MTAALQTSKMHPTGNMVDDVQMCECCVMSKNWKEILTFSKGNFMMRLLAYLPLKAYTSQAWSCFRAVSRFWVYDWFSVEITAFTSCVLDKIKHVAAEFSKKPLKSQYPWDVWLPYKIQCILLPGDRKSKHRQARMSKDNDLPWHCIRLNYLLTGDLFFADFSSSLWHFVHWIWKEWFVV